MQKSVTRLGVQCMRYAGVVILNMQHACMLKDRCAAVHEWNSRHSCRGHLQGMLIKQDIYRSKLFHIMYSPRGQK